MTYNNIEGMTQMDRVEPKVSTRTAWSFLLAIIAMLLIGIGVAVMFGGAEATVALGVFLGLYSIALSLPEKKVF